MLMCSFLSMCRFLCVRERKKGQGGKREGERERGGEKVNGKRKDEDSERERARIKERR